MMYSTLIYVHDLPDIGGIQTMIFHIAKLYGDKDITILYINGDADQIMRLKKLVRVERYIGQKIKCKRAIFNLECGLIDDIDAEEYFLILHGNYETLGTKPCTHPKIDKYFSVSESGCKANSRLIGKPVELIRNPISIDKPERVMKLISATRLTKEKGRERMEEMIKALDEAGIRYQWHVYTNDRKPFDSPNVILMKSRLDILPYIADADYLVQLSSSEGFPYAVYEALNLGTPVIVTDLSCYPEMGLNKDNSFILDMDLKNLNVKEIYKKAGKMKFKFSPLSTKWDEMILDVPETYTKDRKKRYKVRCLYTYGDMVEKRTIQKGEEFVVTGERLEVLVNHSPINRPLVEVVK